MGKVVLIDLTNHPQFKLRPVWQPGDSQNITNSELQSAWRAHCAQPISLPSSADASGDGEAPADYEEYFRNLFDDFELEELDLIDIPEADARMDTSLGSNRIGLSEMYGYARRVLLPIIREQCEDPLTQDVYGGATHNPDQRWLDAEHKYRHLMRVLARVTGPDTKVTYDFTRLLEVAVILLILHEYPASRVEQARFCLYLYLSISISIHTYICL